jgi:hypothetical protein
LRARSQFIKKTPERDLLKRRAVIKARARALSLSNVNKKELNASERALQQEQKYNNNNAKLFNYIL